MSMMAVCCSASFVASGSKMRSVAFSPQTQRSTRCTAFAAPFYVSQKALMALMFSGIALISILRKWLHVYENIEFLTPYMEKSRKCRLRGFVTSVGDSDNFRFRHEPFLRRWRRYVSMLGFLFAFDRKAAIKWRIGSKGVDAVSKNTIHVRLCGVDAPEGMHFGKSGQEGFKEAFKWMKETMDGKNVTIHLLRRDQYSRMVCQVLFRPHWFSPQHDLSLDLLEAGWGVVYKGNEAEYNGNLEMYEDAVNRAQEAKRGIWKNGTDIEGPQEYKRRIRKEK